MVVPGQGVHEEDQDGHGVGPGLAAEGGAQHQLLILQGGLRRGRELGIVNGRDAIQRQQLIEAVLRGIRDARVERDVRRQRGRGCGCGAPLLTSPKKPATQASGNARRASNIRLRVSR